MKSVKTLALAAALACTAFAASAMTTMAEDELSAVSGQDGVSIAANLNVNIGSFKYTDTDATGGSVSFNNITMKGLLGVTIDIINKDTFIGEVATAAGGLPTAAVTAVLTTGGFYDGTSDVVKIAFPNVGLPAALTPSIGVESIKMGNSNASFGSFAMNNINMQGTTVWMWAH